MEFKRFPEKNIEKYRKEKKLEQIIKLLRSGILLYGNTYVIMPIGKNELCSNYGRQNENPSVAALGFSIPIIIKTENPLIGRKKF